MNEKQAFFPLQKQDILSNDHKKPNILTPQHTIKIKLSSGK